MPEFFDARGAAIVDASHTGSLSRTETACVDDQLQPKIAYAKGDIAPRPILAFKFCESSAAVEHQFCMGP